MQKSIRKSLKLRLKKGKKKETDEKNEGLPEIDVGEPTVLVALELDDLTAVEPGEGSTSLVDAMVQTTE